MSLEFTEAELTAQRLANAEGDLTSQVADAYESGWGEGRAALTEASRILIDNAEVRETRLKVELVFAMQRIDELATENAGLRKRLAVGGWQG